MARRIRAGSLGIAIAAIAILPASAQSSPSFDCSLGHSPVEKLICSSPELSDKDRLLALQYNRMREQHPADTAIKQSQMAWWKRREACALRGVAEAACVDRAYNDRLAELTSSSTGSSTAHDEVVAYAKARGTTEQEFAARINSQPSQIEDFVSRIVNNGGTAQGALTSLANVAATARDPSKNWIFGCLGINIYKDQQPAGPRLSQEECDRRVGLGDGAK